MGCRFFPETITNIEIARRFGRDGNFQYRNNKKPLLVDLPSPFFEDCMAFIAWEVPSKSLPNAAVALHLFVFPTCTLIRQPVDD